MMSRKLRILCVDDHAFLVDGLKARFSLEPDLDVIGRLSTAEQLVTQAMQLKPDVVLLDIEMPGPDPFEAADDLRRRCPDTKVVMLSAYVRDHYLSAALKAGVWGYFSKSDDPDSIVEGLRRVAKGEFVMGPKVAERCKPVKPGKRGKSDEPPKSKLDTLTAREQEVLRLIGRGMSRTEIAETIHRSPKTVDGHRERIMAKLDIHSGPELVRFAIREGVAEG
jgi:DNA-binding NarL/FixJ family response regulator